MFEGITATMWLTGMAVAAVGGRADRSDPAGRGAVGMVRPVADRAGVDRRGDQLRVGTGRLPRGGDPHRTVPGNPLGAGGLRGVRACAPGGGSAAPGETRITI